ncbi:Hypothetical protein R9X50_00742000 [Acrodontium crateriforme]|uniref:3-hydroxyisobutyrate dehydrogenase n=1 Tax=Acrodontium crateriforme TaxID=150365 RepID=A0AAQ3RE58_9PEZI|nr:Hypothetical protein R9X50_00742000 [Acrodontium crateriforme]
MRASLSKLTLNASRGSLAALAGPVAAGRRTFATAHRLQATYGFIGLGQMGYPMASNLRSKIQPSDDMIIHDVNSKILEQFQKEFSGVGNVKIADSVRDVAEQSNVVITVLPEPQHVQNVFQVMLKPQNGSASAHHEDRLFIDCSTIDPKSSSQVANAVHSTHQGKFVDAPMSGGVVGAKAGKLTFMLGAPDELIPRVSEVLDKMGKRVVHLGPQTSGLKGKLANNYLLALNNVATAEAMNMGVKWGLDPNKLADMINTATGKCWPSEINNPVPGVSPDAPASRDYAGGFSTPMMLKDLRLALQAAVESDIAPLLGVQAKEIYTAVQADERCAGKDFSVVYRYIGGKE